MLGVGKGGGVLGLPPEALYGLAFLGVLAIEDLEGDLALQDLVVGQVDLGHPPAADLPDEAVPVVF